MADEIDISGLLHREGNNTAKYQVNSFLICPHCLHQLILWFELGFVINPLLINLVLVLRNFEAVVCNCSIVRVMNCAFVQTA